MILTPVCWKFNICNFLDLLKDSVDTSDLLASGQIRPYLIQQDTINVFHDYVFGPN
jgi:hypothetical protein